MQHEVKRKLDESLGPNPQRCISLLLPLLFGTADGVVEVAADSVAVPVCAFHDVPLEICPFTRGSKRELAFRRTRHEGSGAAYIRVTEQTLMTAGKTKGDLIPLSLRMYGIHTSITYLDMRTIVALVRVEEGSVGNADGSILIMGDPCHHKALERSS